jgi:hypothetical protein
MNRCEIQGLIVMPATTAVFNAKGRSFFFYISYLHIIYSTNFSEQHNATILDDEDYLGGGEI